MCLRLNHEANYKVAKSYGWASSWNFEGFQLAVRLQAVTQGIGAKIDHVQGSLGVAPRDGTG